MRARKTTDYETDNAKLKGKHGDQMQSMFDKKGSQSENFHK